MDLRPHIVSLLERLRTFLFSKNVLIFLMFLCLSFFLWLMVSFNKKYETHLSMPIGYSHLPEGIDIPLDLPNKLDIKIKDEGFTILSYQTNDFDTLWINLANYPEFVQNHQVVISPNIVFEKDIRRQLDPGALILDYYPREITISQITLDSKRVPVHCPLQIECKKQYYICDKLRLEPDSVTVYGSKARLDSVFQVFTQVWTKTNVRDTLHTKLNIIAPEHTKTYPQQVKATLPVEAYTEGRVSVPICMINHPSGISIKTVPSEILVSFSVGVSHYHDIKASDFLVTVDYQDLLQSNTQTQFVSLQKTPSTVSNCKMEPDNVQCLLQVFDKE